MSGDRRLKCGPVQLSPADLADYSDRISRLAARVRLMNEADWSPTPERRKAEALAVRLVELADYLDETGTLQFDLEELHDRPPPLNFGEDGWPDPNAYAEGLPGGSYKTTIWRIRALAESARQVAKELPNPGQKTALPFVVMGFLHLRHRFGFPRPKLTAAGPDVAALQDLAQRAGIHLADETLRNELGRRLKDFDPFLIPPGLDEYL